MTLITLRNLSVTLGTPLFTDLSFSLVAGDRLGLVAANGRGKSTLLRCLAGLVEPAAGEITRSRGLRIGHVEQDAPPQLLDQPVDRLLLDRLPADQRESEHWRVEVALDTLAIPEELRRRPLGQLSGGWQRLVLLARAGIAEPDLLLLDEPTNHLDLARIGLLESWLAALPRDMAVILSSHDRAFLDSATGKTLFLRQEHSQLFALPYSRARVALDESDAAMARRNERDLKAVQQMRRQAAKLNNLGINSGSDLLLSKTKQLKRRADELEAVARPAHRERSAGAIRLASQGTHARVLIALDDVAVETPDERLLFKTGKRWISPGDRIVLLGLNGAGKSRFITMLHKAIAGGDQRGIKPTPSLVLGHASQSLAELPDAETPHGLISRRFDIGDQPARGLLAGAGIVIDRQTGPIGALSGGQRARLAMLALRLARPNFYLLDEPTNHLDIEGQEALEAELTAGETSCLLVSHDRSFVRAIGNRFWQIDRRRLVEVDDPETFFAEAMAGEG
ncbi:MULTISPECIES: ABC-F family ATP-binding cassette domain-containing protein [unclassified Bosea (in: a-proteobacteria)]|uniref:ABC-F family ATP-binding cassette domain-containing protein n=1 Tax=unclassified Bosea (in: a-proteobacteria) TaxID=2653178 RepID=UPI000F757753|nr:MULTISPECIES: ABC-F family ATP-binding cassette domain-containing protein [unclassified Bosea (in: a-proteobacteria)]AZO79720.1 ABC transporter [Bosea sp. Tri-49]RXT16026.1 ABC transporter [Bosea sp. Tri-39]RXT39718.1 ABC transporter [Bosea sp. Tri-54]